MALMQEQTGMTGAELRKLMSQKKISTKLFASMFDTMNKDGGFAFKGMIKMSETAAGKFSTLKDNIAITAASIGDKLMPAVKWGLDLMNGWLQGSKKEMKAIEEQLYKFGSGELIKKYEKTFDKGERERMLEEFKESSSYRHNYKQEEIAIDVEAEKQKQEELAALKEANEENRKKEEAKKSKNDKKMDKEKIASSADVMKQMAGMQKSNNKVLAATGKAAALTSIGIETHKMAMSWAAWAGNPILSGILAAMAYAWGAEKAASVAGIQLAEGGTVMGGMGTSPYRDSVPASLQVGETVISRKLTDSLARNADSPPVQSIDQSSKVIVEGNMIADDDQQIDNLIERINERTESYGARLVASDTRK